MEAEAEAAKKSAASTSLVSCYEYFFHIKLFKGYLDKKFECKISFGLGYIGLLRPIFQKNGFLTMFVP